MVSPTNDLKGTGFGKLRVLVMEGESPVGFSISEFLLDLGFDVKRVQTMEDVTCALRLGLISFFPYHLIIIDEDMLGEDAGQTLMTIQQKSGKPSFRIILLTSEAAPQPEMEALRSVSDAYIQKPVREAFLRAALHEALNSQSAQIQSHTKRKRILIVEDDVLSLELMKIVLTKNGYEVTLSSSGTEALETCKKDSFDLVFMDLQMPDMDGFTTAKKIRDLETDDRHIPIIALTASNIAGNAYARFNEEFARILTKPFEIPTILNAIEEVTSQLSTPTSRQGMNGGKHGVINVPQALRHFGLDREQFMQIFDEFRASLPGRLAEMEEAFRHDDFTGLARCAHNLKGIAANVGAMQLSEASARLDEQSSNNEVSSLPKTLDEIRSAAESLQADGPHHIEEYFSSTSLSTRDE